MMAASCDDRKTAADAISDGRANRPTGISLRALSPFSPDQPTVAIGLSTTVGEMALTVIPYCAHSSASTFVRPISPALLAPYAACSAIETTPACEAMLILRPR